MIFKFPDLSKWAHRTGNLTEAWHQWCCVVCSCSPTTYSTLTDRHTHTHTHTYTHTHTHTHTHTICIRYTNSSDFSQSILCCCSCSRTAMTAAVGLRWRVPSPRVLGMDPTMPRLSSQQPVPRTSPASCWWDYAGLSLTLCIKELRKCPVWVKKARFYTNLRQWEVFKFGLQLV